MRTLDNEAPWRPSVDLRDALWRGWRTFPRAEATGAAPVRPFEPCEIEGQNGHRLVARLLWLDLASRVAHVQVAPAWAPLPLRFSQFRRLRLTQPWFSSDGRSASSVNPYWVRWNGGLEMNGEAVHLAEQPEGLLLQEPGPAPGTTLRSFIPRAAYEEASLGENLETRHLRRLFEARQVATPERLGEALETTPLELGAARLGETLIALDHLRPMQLELALARQREERSRRLGELLVIDRVITPLDLREAFARKAGCVVIDLARYPVDPRVLQRVPLSTARRLRALPVCLWDGRMVMVMDDPSDADATRELAFLVQRKIVPAMATRGPVDMLIEHHYEEQGLAGPMWHG